MACVAGFRLAAGGVGFYIALMFVLSLMGAFGAGTALAVDDIASSVGAWVAGGLAWWRSYRARGLCRWWRALVGCAMVSWSAGEALWSWYQIAAHIPLPIPSQAAVGYLLMPMFMLPALLLVATRAGSRLDEENQLNWRQYSMLVLDGLIVVFSMLLLAWQTTLAAAVEASAPSRLAFLIALAYPVTDLVLVALVILVAVFRRIAPTDRLPLLLLGLGLTCISASDSVLSYLVSTGVRTMAPVTTMGFVAGPALIALAMLAPPTERIGSSSQATSHWGRWPHMLPYLPLSGCVALIMVWTTIGREITTTARYLGALILALVIARQLITLMENTALFERVREGQARLAFQAFHDSLTGLPNRALFGDRLGHAAQLHSRDLRMFALIFADLDDFKRINDQYGHHVGDQLLKAVGERLLGCVRSADTVARFGGDEFAVLLEGDDLTGDRTPEQVSNRILAALSRPFVIDTRTMTISASLGVVVPEPGESGLTAGELLRRADSAMYSGKWQGKGQIVVHQSSPETAHEMLSRLTSALAPDRSGNGFEVFYQPIVRLSDHMVVAVEALVRWRTPSGRHLPPAEFVPLLERAGLAPRLDTLVLTRACAELAAIEARLGGVRHLHVNISSTWAGTPELLDTVDAVLAGSRVPGTKLVLELTETGPSPDLAATARTIDRLHAVGVRVALDDFGAGFNNLGLLTQLDVDMVKLDRAMISTDATGRLATARRLIIEFSRSEGLTLVAEGVETVRQAKTLSSLGYELGQGYLFGRPVPLAELGGSAVAGTAPAPE